MTRRIAHFLLFALALAAPACVQDPPQVPGTRSLPIVDGTRELGEEAVVLVQGVIGSCTGTVITERVVLTAKHCVQQRAAEEPAPASFFYVGVGNSARTIRSFRVREVLTTPGGFFGPAITDGSDIALLIMRDPITDVTPIAVRRAAPTDLVGREVTAIGFGLTPDGESGIKYRTTTSIDSISDQVLFGTLAICQGDSGGPIWLEADGTSPREIVGVASYGQTMAGGPSCPAVLDAWNRVDIHLDLIDEAILRSGGCVDRGEETCNSLDDDCNGTVDDGCTELGEPCTADEECRYAALPESFRDGAPPSVICADVGGARRCALPCDALAPATSCGAIDVAFRTDDVALEGFFCAQSSGCEGLCAPGAAGTRTNGEACASDAECASLFCADVGVCATPCLGGVATCPSDEVCTADATQCGFCANTSARPTGRALGEPCATPDECASFGCGVLDGRSICTAVCENDVVCGDGMRCDGRYCVRGDRADISEACGSDDDCSGSAVCLVVDGRGFCSARCTTSAPCAGTCTPHGDDMRCVPDGSLLGAACTDTCLQGECIAGTCTALCGGDLTCPIDHDCVREGGATVCRPRPSGGCSVGRGGSPGALGMLVLALAAVAARRRRAAIRIG